MSRWAALPDLVAAAALTLFAMARVVVPPPNLDLWWLLAVGRRMAETHAFIYHDPFTFTVPGTPWSPQSWASALLYYALFKVGGLTAISALRVALTGLVVALVLRAQRAAGVSWALAAPLLAVAILAAHGRFADRGQLFEYVFLAWLVGFLLAAHDPRTRAYFVLPLAVELAWVQFHSSFLLGPALAAIFFSGEWVASRLPGARVVQRHDFRRAALLVVLLLLVCAINPNPRAFLLQPFDASQRELVSRFTLEWKSPFDAAVAGADFHPWYEVMLGAALLGIVAAVPRIPLAPALVTIATAVLSLQSHRFRAEFVLVAAVMVPVMLRGSWLVSRLAASRVPRTAWTVAGTALALVLMATYAGRAGLEPQRKLLPGRAFAFVAANDIAQRPFHTIGFGSGMLWELYGKRATFIDGRNFDPGLYGDFLRAQSNAPALRSVVQKYRVDSFIIPAPERSDAGMRNVHEALLAWGSAWPLVFMDETAFVYVARASADSTWLAAHEYRAYHPLTFLGRPHSAADMERALKELSRLTTDSPDYAEGWKALGLARLSRGEARDAMGAFARAVEIDGKDATAWNQLGQAAAAAGDFARAVQAFTALTRLLPTHANAFVDLSRAQASAGDTAAAVASCRRALDLDSGNAQARELMQALQSAR